MIIKRQEWLINCNICTTLCKMLTIGRLWRTMGALYIIFAIFLNFFISKKLELKSNKQLKLFVCFKVRSLCFCFLAMLPGFQNLSFPTKGWIQAEAVRDQVLNPLDHQGNPLLLKVGVCWPLTSCQAPPYTNPHLILQTFFAPTVGWVLMVCSFENEEKEFGELRNFSKCQIQDCLLSKPLPFSNCSLKWEWLFFLVNIIHAHTFRKN